MGHLESGDPADRTKSQAGTNNLINKDYDSTFLLKIQIFPDLSKESWRNHYHFTNVQYIKQHVIKYFIEKHD